MARVGGGPGGAGGGVMTALVPRGSGGAHPAGIFSDLSVDGPVIGTLVVILDRGKNLPNRKTLGKQDPYCVVRLGKEAKRTEPDKRGGQTPKWDKELRFEVRDSPDYRTLKLTCFNDDKKTDLIGECTVRLDKILIAGGGQDDDWRQLHFKGKYAGEIRVEITFYDLREKKIEFKRVSRGGSDERSGYDEGEGAHEDTQEEPEVVTGPRALAGMGQLSQARRERDKERRRQKEAEFKKERDKERMKKEPARRALPSEPSIPSTDTNSAEARKREQKLREREKEREKERERQLREREKRVAQRSSRHPEDYEREKERELRERQIEREKRLQERERRRRRETYAGEYETRDRGEYVDSRRSRHPRGMSHSPIPPPPPHQSGRAGASPIPPHRGGASPIPPHRGGASPIPPQRGGASPIPHRGDRGHSPIPPHRGNSDPRGHSPIPPHRGNSDPRGHSPIPPHRGNSDPRGHSPIPPRRADERGGQSPIPPLRADRGVNSPIPPNRRHTAYEMYGDQYHTDYDDMDDGYGGQLALTHSHSHTLPSAPPPPPSHQGNHPALPPLQTVQPLYNNPNSSQAQLYSKPNSSQVFNHPNGSFVSLSSPDGPPPPPPPHRHMQGQSSNPQLRNQLPQPPQPLLLKHQASHMTLQHKPSQMQLTTVQKQPTRKLKHQASVADWAATQEIEIDPQKIPAGAVAVLPKLGTLRQRPRAPSSTYTSAPDFEALSKPDALNNDEFDDTGRFAPGAPPIKPMPKVTPSSNPAGDINAGALVPAGFNYAASDPPGYWKPPPFGHPRPRSDSDSTAMVITSQKQKPPPPQYNSAANSRRNSFIGDHPIPPSLIPGFDPTLAELIAEDEKRGKEMALAAATIAGGAGSVAGIAVGQVMQQGPQQQQAHALPPAPYIEEVNDREDGGRRRSANGAAGLQLAPGAAGKGPGATLLPQLASTAEGVQAQGQAAQLSDGPSSGSANTPAAGGGGALEPIVPPPQPPSRAKTKRLDGIPFSPDAYNLINPKPNKVPLPARGSTVIRTANNAPAATASSSTTPNSTSIALAGRKPDEILPPESFAPEPEPKPKSAAQLQAEAEAEMQMQLRKARGITGVREMAPPQAQPPLPPAYTTQKLPIAIPERGSSSRINVATRQRKQLALPPTDGALPPPPPGHQTLVVVGNGSKSNSTTSPTKAGTVRNKLQKVHPQKSIDNSMRGAAGGEITPYESTSQLSHTQQHQQATSLSMQIAQHEARMKREAEHAAQRRAAAEAKTREEKARRNAAYNNRHSIAGPPLAGYRDSYARHSTAALPGYSGGIAGEEEGAMVLHRHRSAEPVWDGAPGRRSYDATATSSTAAPRYNSSRNPSRNPSREDLSRVPSYAELAGNNDGYGMVLYRPGGSGNSGAAGPGSTSSGPSSSAGPPYNGYGGSGGYASGYASGNGSRPVSNSGSATSASYHGGRARGGSEPPRPGAGFARQAEAYNGGGYAGRPEDESMALMSQEEWLLSQELRGISIGVGSTTGGSTAGGGRSGGTVARRGGGRGY